MGGAFEAESADHFVALDGNPKTAIPLGIVGRNTIDFFPQRTLNIRLKGVAEVGRAEKPVDSDEQLPDLSGIVLRERADGYLWVQNLIPAGELPRVLAIPLLRSNGVECACWYGRAMGAYASKLASVLA